MEFTSVSVSIFPKGRWQIISFHDYSYEKSPRDGEAVLLPSASVTAVNSPSDTHC